MPLNSFWVAGVDEAGRGPLAGPVFAAAVVLDETRPIQGLRDSKKLSAAAREGLCKQVETHALAFAVAQASVEEIDRLNILQATLLAMRRAVAALRLPPECLPEQQKKRLEVWVDGLQAPDLSSLPAAFLANLVGVRTVVRGDALVPAISAASILAKVHRDAHCQALHQTYPQYGFAQHKGYGTAAHLAALRTHGPCPAHRRSFAPVAAAALAEGSACPVLVPSS